MKREKHNRKEKGSQGNVGRGIRQKKSVCEGAIKSNRDHPGRRGEERGRKKGRGNERGRKKKKE